VVNGGADPRLRRVGFAGVKLVWCDDAPQVIGGVIGALKGLQTVPRSELIAIEQIVLGTSGNITIYTDHKTHVDKWAKGKSACLNAALADIWWRIWKHVEDNRRSIQIIHVKAHRKLHELDWSDPACFRSWLGNEVADHLAGQIAERIQVTDQAAEELQYMDKQGWHWSRRLVDVVLAHWEALPLTVKVKSDRRGARARFVAAKVQASSHILVRQNGGCVPKWWCLRCRCSASLGEFVGFAESVCTPQVSLATAVGNARKPQTWERLGVDACSARSFHPSHLVAFHAGLHVCWTCGCYSLDQGFKKPRVQLLDIPCRLIPGSCGVRVLQRLSQGLTPISGTEWPSLLDAGARCAVRSLVATSSVAATPIIEEASSAQIRLKAVRQRIVSKRVG